MLEAMAKNINALPRMAEKLNKSDKPNTAQSLLLYFFLMEKNQEKQSDVTLQTKCWFVEVLNPKQEGNWKTHLLVQKIPKFNASQDFNI